MSYKNRYGTWVVPEDQVEEFYNSRNLDYRKYCMEAVEAVEALQVSAATTLSGNCKKDCKGNSSSSYASRVRKKY